MNAVDETALLETASRTKSIVSGLQVARHGILLLCAALFAVKAVVMPVINWSLVKKKDWGKPRKKTDPMATLLTARFFRSGVDLESLRGVRCWEDLHQFRFMDRDHLRLRFLVMSGAAAFIHDSGRDIGDATLQSRMYWWERLLWADSYGGRDPILSAKTDLENKWKGKRAKEKFPKNFQTSVAEHRVGTFFGRYERLADQPYAEQGERRGSRSAREIKGGKVSQPGKVTRGARRRSDSSLLMTRTPAPGQPCKGQISEIIKGLMAQTDDSVCVISALSFATIQDPQYLLEKREIPVLTDDGAYKSWRAFAGLHRAPAPGLYLASRQEVPIYWPQLLASKYLAIPDSELSEISLYQISTTLKQQCATATWRKIRDSLVRHGSAWYGMPCSWTWLAAHPSRKPPAFVHYDRVSTSRLRDLRTFLSLFHYDF